MLISVDPDSPQADNLRHLLNVVSGRARDDAGKLSEPIVKEELAIVEFLTAKNPSKAVAAISNSDNGPARAEGSDENTPVDLLLGLAKTNTGRRAAEEEKRQLRLQQRREQEEQRQAQRRMQSQSGINGSAGLSANPWNYVAPQMPGLDVHQPFGEQNNRRMPRPLQPPGGGKRDSTGSSSWSPDNPFGFNDNARNSPSFNNTNILPQQPQQPQFGNNNASNQQSINISPYQDMTLLPSPNDQILAGQADGLFQQGGTTGLEFGAAIGESFDFSNLGLPREGGDVGFNPFAIAQTGDEG